MSCLRWYRLRKTFIQTLEVSKLARELLPMLGRGQERNTPVLLALLYERSNETFLVTALQICHAYRIDLATLLESRGFSNLGEADRPNRSKL
jgi:hypothetical protein